MTLHVLGCTLLVACSSFSSSEGPNPSMDGGAAPTTEAGAPDAAPMDAGAPDADVDGGCVTVSGTLDADTDLAGCNSGSPTGLNASAVIGSNGALFRFTFGTDAVSALTAARSITGATLHLDSSVKASPGVIEAHVARSDWDEGTTKDRDQGCDECRRKNGSQGNGWGATVQRWDPVTTMIASATDYDPTSSVVTLLDGATSVDFPIVIAPTKTSTIAAFPASGTISFFVKMDTQSQFVAVTKELASGVGAATLAVTYCK